MFTVEQMLIPIWDTELVYHESLTFVKERGIAAAPLLYEPTEIISVKNASQTIEYEKDKDWYADGNMIYLTPGSKIFCFEEDELYPVSPIPGHSYADGKGGYVLFYEEHFFHDRQICVTYRCKKGQWKGHTPKGTGHELPKTFRKLKNKETISIVLYGDSISAGSNASGFTISPPFQPSWGDLFTEALRKHYEAAIKFYNPSVGGMNSTWGVENADTLVNTKNPDLVIIAFGMNDRIDTEKFSDNIRKIIDIIRLKNPHAEFILAVTTLPNPRLTYNFHDHRHEYGEALRDLCKEGMAVADFQNMQKELLLRKRFIDMTGNNVNHPNDFFIRCHAQYLSAMLIPNK